MAISNKLKVQLLRSVHDDKLKELEQLAVREERFEDAAMIRDERNARLEKFRNDYPSTPDDMFASTIPVTDETWCAWICKNGGHVHQHKDALNYACHNGHFRYFQTREAAKKWITEACSGKNFYRGICAKHMPQE